jgi:hypothetical protein
MAPVEEPSPNAQAEEQDESRDVISASSRKTNKRAKYGKLDWDVHKEELKKLYLDENKELAEIMQLMQERHGFEASSVLSDFILCSITNTTQSEAI